VHFIHLQITSTQPPPAVITPTHGISFHHGDKHQNTIVIPTHAMVHGMQPTWLKCRKRFHRFMSTAAFITTVMPRIPFYSMDTLAHRSFPRGHKHRAHPTELSCYLSPQSLILKHMQELNCTSVIYTINSDIFSCNQRSH